MNNLTVNDSVNSDLTIGINTTPAAQPAPAPAPAPKKQPSIYGEVPQIPVLDAVEGGLCLIEAGHHATELPVCEKLAELLRSADPTLEIKIAERCPIARHPLGKE